MAGWLGKGFASQLDNIKSQVSSIAKEVFVEEGDEEGEAGLREEGDVLKQLHNRCKYLEDLNKETIREKEEQCANFRQLLLEKEEEIMQIQQLMDEEPEADDTGGDSTNTEKSGENKKIRERNRKLQTEVHQLKEQARLAADQADQRVSELERRFVEERETLESDLLQKDKDLEKADANIKDLENELRSTQSQQSAILQKLEEKAEAEARQHSGALERLEQSNLAALEEMEQSHDEQLKLLNGIVKEKEIKLLDLATVHQSQMNLKEEEWEGERRSFEEKFKSLINQQLKDEDSWRAREAELNQELTDMKSSLAAQTEAWQQEKKELSKQLADLSDSLPAMQIDDVVAELQKEKDELCSELKVVKTLNEGLTSSNGELAESNISLSRKLEATDAQLQSAYNAATVLETKIVEISREKETEVSAAKLRLEESLGCISAEEDKRRLVVEELDALKIQIEAASLKTEAAKSEAEASRSEAKTYKETMDELKQRLDTQATEKLHLEDVNKENFKVIAKLKESNSTKDSQISLLEEVRLENESLKKRLEKLGKGGENPQQSSNQEVNGNDAKEDLYDITSLVEENRELKSRIQAIMVETDRRRRGERKLEAGELSILLKMKNVDLEHRYQNLQQENASLVLSNETLSQQNFELRSRSDASSVLSFPSVPEPDDPSKERDKLRALNENLTEKLLDKDTTLQIQASQVKQLEINLSEKESSSETQASRVKELETLLSEKETTLDTQVKQFETQLSEKNSSLEAQESQIKELETKLSDKNTGLEIQAAQVKQLETQLSENKALLSKEQETVKNLQIELKSSHDVLDQIKEQIDAVEVEKTKLVKELGIKLETISTLHNNIALYEKEIKGLEAEKRQLKDAEFEQQSVVNSLTQELQDNRNQFEKLKADLEHRDKLDKVSEDLIVTETNAKLEAIGNELREKRNELLQSQETIRSMTAKADLLTREAETARDEVGQLQQGLQQTLADKEFEIRKLKEASQGLTSQVEALNGQMEEEQSSRLHLESHYQSVLAQSEELRTEITNQKAELAKLEGLAGSEAESLRQQLDEAVSREQRLAEQLHSSRQENSNLTTVREQLSTKENELTATATEIQNRLADRESELGERCAEVDRLKQANAELNQALADIKGMNDLILNSAREKEKEMNGTKQTIASLETSKAQMISELERLRRELEASTGQTEALQKELGDYKARMEAELKDLENRIAGQNSAAEDGNHMVQVLNEKTRELTQARAENHHLQTQVAEERERRDQLELAQAELRESYTQMKNETIKKLSSLVRDKELEIESLTTKNQSLLDILKANNGAGGDISKDGDNVAGRVETTADHTQELLRLRARISELETELARIASDRDIFNNVVASNNLDASKAVNCGVGVGAGEMDAVRARTEELESQVAELNEKLRVSQEDLGRLRTEAQTRSVSNNAGQAAASEKSAEHRAEVERLRNDLMTLAADHNSLEARFKAKENEARELQREVKAIIDKKKWVESEVDRLRGHLVEVEDGYTQELMQGESREQELRARVGALEDQVKKASLSHSEASQEANEATTHLTEALTAAATSRDTFSDQLKANQAKLREKTSALRNLQMALEGFQRQKENEIRQVEKRCSDRVAAEQERCAAVSAELAAAKTQIEQAGAGLEAATRLSQQLDSKVQLISSLKHEVSTREQLLNEANKKLELTNKTQVGRVDRELVKNLILGYVTADSARQAEILKVIATVLDFNKEEHVRSGLESGGGGWFGGFMRGRRDSSYQRKTDQINQSIAQAFVEFLEQESVPHSPVVLPVVEMAKSKQDEMNSNSRSSPSPLLLNPLPTLSPSQNILKTVLHESSEKK